MAKLTQCTIDKLKPDQTGYFVWDEELSGFGVRVYPSGRLRYVVQCRNGRQTRRIAVGSTKRLSTPARPPRPMQKDSLHRQPWAQILLRKERRQETARQSRCLPRDIWPTKPPLP
jgi:hypothetical protein